MPRVEREMEVLENQLDVLSNICSAKFVPLHNLQTEMGGMEAAQYVMQSDAIRGFMSASKLGHCNLFRN